MFACATSLSCFWITLRMLHAIFRGLSTYLINSLHSTLHISNRCWRAVVLLLGVCNLRRRLAWLRQNTLATWGTVSQEKTVVLSDFVQISAHQWQVKINAWFFCRADKAPKKSAGVNATLSIICWYEDISLKNVDVVFKMLIDLIAFVFFRRNKAYWRLQIS